MECGGISDSFVLGLYYRCIVKSNHRVYSGFFCLILGDCLMGSLVAACSSSNLLNLGDLQRRKRAAIVLLSGLEDDAFYASVRGQYALALIINCSTNRFNPIPMASLATRKS